MKKYVFSILAGIVVAFFFLAGIYVYISVYGLPVQAGMSNATVDVLGSRVGTSTTPAYFMSSILINGTSTKVLTIGDSVDTAIFTVKVVNASTTPGGLFSWLIEGTNDAGCTTLATSTTDYRYNPAYPLVSNITWYPLGADQSRAAGSIYSTATANASTSDITLTNLNWNCLRFGGNGSSSAVLVQVKTKNLFTK